MERDQRIEYTVLFSPQFPIGWNQAGGKLQKEGKQLRKEKQRADKSIYIYMVDLISGLYG